MGLKYNKNDGQLFISAMNHNVSSANEIVSRLKAGSDHLISMVNGGSAQLSGKAYNAVGTLFTSLVQPVLSKLESATEDIKNDIQVFQSQSFAFNAFNDTIYDEERLNHLKEIKQQQQATVLIQIGMFNNTLLGDLAKNVTEELIYEGKRLENVAEHYANEIKEIDDKLRILHEFSSSTSHLFQESLIVFQSAMQGVKSLNQGRFDSNGNFSMPAGSDMSWYKTLTNQKLDSALVSDDEAEREELLKGLDVNGLTDKDRDKYESSVSDILNTLQKQGWTKAGLEAYLNTLATINSNSHSAGDVFSIDSFIENAQLMKLLLDNASHLDVSKYVEKGWEWEKTNTYYFVNGESNFVLTELGAYLPNFKVTKQASPEEIASVSKVQEDVVVNPAESGAILTIEGLSEITELEKMTDSKEFLGVLKNKMYTNPSNSMYNFDSSIKGYSAARKEFDSMSLSNIKIYNEGTSKEVIVGYTKNGDKVNLHSGSSVNGAPSIEIQDSVDSYIKIKIRY
ncbi:hypothetical protein IAE51_06560 [Lactococcus sp. S64]|uniref:hypothetical protein n=1 Tax=Lactococcus sp. S64 TaxID=2767459 RepID=UPI0019055D9D|nr:hypothetical protein [Lactococcus sp. S64]MBK0083566.1 hypothetical protein [Lactococcus sp. S64]